MDPYHLHRETHMFRHATIRIAYGVLFAGLLPLVLGQGCPRPAGIGPPAGLAGTWSGQISMNMTIATSSTGPVDVDDPGAMTITSSMPLTISYSDTGVPTGLPVMGMGAGTGPPGSGGTSAVRAGQTSTIEINGMTIIVTIREASYTPTRTRVVIDTTMSGQMTSPATPGSDMIMTMHGATTQTIQSVLSADGSTLTWTQNSEGTTETTTTSGATGTTFQMWSAQRMDMTGTLTRQ